MSSTNYNDSISMIMNIFRDNLLHCQQLVCGPSSKLTNASVENDCQKYKT